jgi:cyclic lactone autoinducer peptide
MRKISVGILVNQNSYNGIAKLSAMMANDLANKNCNVIIYAPVFPYYFYYFKIFKNIKSYIFWVKYFFLIPLFNFFLKKKIFAMKDILNKKKLYKNFIKIEFYYLKISKKKIQNLDHLIINGIGDIIQYANVIEQKKITYLVNQIEERYHGSKYKKLYEKIRRNFKGNTITHCDFMKNKMLSYKKNVKIVINPISKGIWKFRKAQNAGIKRRDILIYWKNDSIFSSVNNFIEEIVERRKKIKITIFARGSSFENKKLNYLKNKFNIRCLYNLNEREIVNIYRDHKFLFYPNTYEDFGMPPVEGLSCGCIPILRANVGAASMYAVNNFNSIYLSNNMHITCKKILNILDNNKKLMRLSKNAKKNLNQFSPLKYGNKILNLNN